MLHDDWSHEMWRHIALWQPAAAKILAHKNFLTMLAGQAGESPEWDCIRAVSELKCWVYLEIIVLNLKLPIQCRQAVGSCFCLIIKRRHAKHVRGVSSTLSSENEFVYSPKITTKELHNLNSSRLQIFCHSAQGLERAVIAGLLQKRRVVRTLSHRIIGV